MTGRSHYLSDLEGVCSKAGGSGSPIAIVHEICTSGTVRSFWETERQAALLSPLE